MNRAVVGFSFVCLLASPLAARADDKAPAATPAKTPAKEELHKRFESMLKGVKFVGRFTVLGKDDGPLPKEEYTIHSVKKVEGDKWQFNTRVKYGRIDLPVSMKLPVKWAGDTAVISLTDLKIPVLGTFSARVVIYNKKYAGTWAHGQVGGHLFGTIEKIKSKEKIVDKQKKEAAGSR